jgi:hypothetical protein
MENTSTSLALADIVAMKNIIDVVTTRGAFKANELSSIGQLYDKLTQFIETVSAELENKIDTNENQNLGE